jgi:hypothetical protein
VETPASDQLYDRLATWSFLKESSSDFTVAVAIEPPAASHCVYSKSQGELLRGSYCKGEVSLRDALDYESPLLGAAERGGQEYKTPRTANSINPTTRFSR